MSDRADFRRATAIAQSFHDSYTRFAPALGWEPQADTAAGWDDLPAANRQLMLVVALDLLSRGLVR